LSSCHCDFMSRSSISSQAGSGFSSVPHASRPDGGKAANFLDVGGGAESERVMNAVRLVASVPAVKVIVVNLLGGITKCDEVAKGIIAAGISQKVIVRLAGTNEAEGRRLLSEKGYEMLDTMDLVVKKAVEVTA